MTAVVDVDTSLASKCMDFCQALANQGQAFNFSLTITSGFSFSLDTRKKAASPDVKKKASPSTLRRNAKRKEEYLKQKQNHSTVNHVEEVGVASSVPSCDQCDFKSVSEKGLRQHKRMKHALSNSQTTPEKTRTSSSSASLAASPLLDTSREEFSPEANKGGSCQDCKNDDCAIHCCEIHKCGGCEMVFINHDDMGDHMAKIHPFMCHICNLECVDYDGRFKHHNTIHVPKYP